VLAGWSGRPHAQPLSTGSPEARGLLDWRDRSPRGTAPRDVEHWQERLEPLERHEAGPPHGSALDFRICDAVPFEHIWRSCREHADLVQSGRSAGPCGAAATPSRRARPRAATLRALPPCGTGLNSGSEPRALTPCSPRRAALGASSEHVPGAMLGQRPIGQKIGGSRKIASGECQLLAARTTPGQGRALGRALCPFRRARPIVSTSEEPTWSAP
jgi:hypothetical protein